MDSWMRHENRCANTYSLIKTDAEVTGSEWWSHVIHSRGTASVFNGSWALTIEHVANAACQVIQSTVGASTLTPRNYSVNKVSSTPGDLDCCNVKKKSKDLDNHLCNWQSSHPIILQKWEACQAVTLFKVMEL